jgi:hypothetical protein
MFDGKVTGLFLSPTKTGSKWTFRFASPATGERRDAGLGSYPKTLIAKAHEEALAMRSILNDRGHPIDQRNRERDTAAFAAAALTFEKAAREVHAEPQSGPEERKVRRSVDQRSVWRHSNRAKPRALPCSL